MSVERDSSRRAARGGNGVGAFSALFLGRVVELQVGYGRNVESQRAPVSGILSSVV